MAVQATFDDLKSVTKPENFKKNNGRLRHFMNGIPRVPVAIY